MTNRKKISKRRLKAKINRNRKAAIEINSANEEYLDSIDPESGKTIRWIFDNDPHSSTLEMREMVMSANAYIHLLLSVCTHDKIALDNFN